MENLRLTNLGAKDESHLDFKFPILYSSRSLITSMSYSGPAQKIMESTAFAESFKEKLVGIQGLVSLGSTGGALRNVHVYSRNAERLDGLERICYLEQEANQLVVSEYSGNRGAKYSALYKMLSKELQNEGFSSTQNKFTILEEDIVRFIEVQNRVIDNRESGAYELVPINEVDSLIIDKQRYYYYKAYWQAVAISTVSQVSTGEGNRFNNNDEAFRVLVNHSKFCHDKSELLRLAEKLDKLSKILANRINNLDEFEELSPGL